MATFVLVHGAWHGGWCWKETAHSLRASGHIVYTPTLTGLGERSHLLTPEIDADLHVQDVVGLFQWEELEDVILVGHSYGGVVITGVAGQVPDKIRSLIYLDAFAPEQSGVSIFANANPQRMAAFEAQIAKGRHAVEPDLFDAWSEDPDKRAWLKDMCTPHPIECLRRGVTLTGAEKSIKERHYIICARNDPSAFWSEYERVRHLPEWTTHEIATKHDAMVDAPEALAVLLAGIADG
ncbi:alpha/beta hydrolase family protein [Marivita sp.]|uniref:alpha/beta fold hydrolase n=1 Tax=Marivita sp. TaxID=2003365 RepID=UPI0032194F89